ncbi:MAG: hypothetical protein R3B72_30465 [Polyangiaceae bacterium]
MGVSGLGPAKAIAAGKKHACAVGTDNSIRCWGSNANGQLGNGNTANASTPVLVQGLIGATAIYAGGDHTCAVTTDGRFYCWGRNDDGQLGTGDTMTRLTPTEIVLPQ